MVVARKSCIGVWIRHCKGWLSASSGPNSGLTLCCYYRELPTTIAMICLDGCYLLYLGSWNDKVTII